MLEAGMKAPDFTLEDKDGNLVSLHDFAGKKVVVYFLPEGFYAGLYSPGLRFPQQLRRI